MLFFPKHIKKFGGGHLDIVETNINNFIKIRRLKHKERPFLRLSFCVQDDNYNEQTQFLNKWMNNGADIVDFQELLDFSNVNKLKDLPKHDIWCDNPFNRLVVEYQGDILACCNAGYRRYMKIGNINEMSLEEAWNSPMICELRESFINHQYSKVCLNCRQGITTI